MRPASNNRLDKSRSNELGSDTIIIVLKSCLVLGGQQNMAKSFVLLVSLRSYYGRDQYFFDIAEVEAFETTIYRPHTFELKSTSKYQLLFHLKNFELNYMIVYTLPWSRCNSTHKLWNTCVVPFAITKSGQKCLEVAPILKYEPF